MDPELPLKQITISGARLDGAESDPLPVISGVPQGSILGPLLFLTYIDKVTSLIRSSNIILYADDIALYLPIKEQSDYSQLQEDVTSLSSWVTANHLKLNVSKCCFMTFSRKRSPLYPDAPLHVGDNCPLSRVDDFKYLGVTLSFDFTWSKHITSICNKTRKLIGMYYRKFYKYSNQVTSLKLYKSIIRPHLEYASPVWSPHLVKDIKCIEDVQKLALSVCTKYWDSNYESLLSSCNMDTMSNRRNISRLCLLFKITSGDVFFENLPYDQPCQKYPSRHLNTQQLSVQFARTNTFQSSFFPGTTLAWNNLNFDTSGICLRTFKSKLQLM